MILISSIRRAESNKGVSSDFQKLLSMVPPRNDPGVLSSDPDAGGETVVFWIFEVLFLGEACV